MNLQELLQGVLSGRYATTAGPDPYGAGKAAIGRDLGNLAGILGPRGTSDPNSWDPRSDPAAPGTFPPVSNTPGMIRDIAHQRFAMGGQQPPMGPGRKIGLAEIGGALQAPEMPPVDPGNDFNPLQPQSSPQPGNGVLAQNNATAMRNQYDPFQPQASPQPGNGVLALDNATSMAQANPMGPEGVPQQGPPNAPPAPPGGPPMALQSTDESTPVPQAKPSGALAAPTPDTAKSDPHTRAKGILAAAVSGDPQAIQQAVMDPQAASQAGSQVPDGPNWNPGSAYDTADAPLPPKNAADAQKQADAAHAQDKQQTFGQKALGVLANPDTGLLLQSIGVGLLTSKNPWQGIGQGVQMYQQLHLKNQDRQLEAQRVAVQERRADTAEKQGQQQIDQGQQRIGLDKGDQEIRRTAEENIARYRAQQLQQSGAELSERARHDRADEGNTAAATRATLARLNMEMGQPVSSQVLPSADGTGAYSYNRYRDGRTEVTKLPDGVAAGLSLVNPQMREDAKNETALVGKGSDALHALDETSKVDELLAKDPNGIGPSYKAGIARWAAVKLGLGDSGDPVQELRQLKAQGALSVESALHNVRGSNLVLNTVKDAVNNIENMPPAVIRSANEARKQDALADLQASDAFLQRRPDRATSSTWSDYVARRDRMNSLGGARSGVDTSGNSVVSGKLSNGMEFQFTPGG